ncbi:hypothetical protein ABT337_19885 [Saccharopolyspora hirsuta]|uniref:Uncharacterized protein n=1 Tax=Saccharopolyspora hirsuta TaxID=1837 RepID=A0A5M7C4P0_SACHI|nr:hypothetical protein [Saccharopolyspora hirsuta]KAA5833335.1 hypothetical protein F1721_13585 [Saccharopolyspora hirsuta]MBF6508002.1 hypothetical protein [Nocardia farcinica]
MIYVLAAIGALTIAVLMWKAFGPVATGPDRPRSRQAPIAPDDDPDFLRRLDEQRRKSRPAEDE